MRALCRCGIGPSPRIDHTAVTLAYVPLARVALLLAFRQDRPRWVSVSIYEFDFVAADDRSIRAFDFPDGVIESHQSEGRAECFDFR